MEAPINTFIEISTNAESMCGGLELTPEQTAVIVEAITLLQPLLPEDFSIAVEGINIVPETA